MGDIKKKKEEYIANTARLIGKIIRKRRKELGLTQQKICEDYCFCSKNFLSQVERGKPTAEIGRVLDVLRILRLKVYIRPDGESDE